MIHSHRHGHFLSLLRADGHTQGYIVAPGHEADARTFIWCHMLREDLTPAEAAQLVRGTVQIESPATSSQPLSPTLGLREKMLSLARAAIDRVARLLAGRAEDEAETCSGK